MPNTIKGRVETVNNQLNNKNSEKIQQIAPNIARKQGIVSQNVDKTLENGYNIINKEESENARERQTTTRSELGDNIGNNERREGRERKSNEGMGREESGNGSSNVGIRPENISVTPEHKVTKGKDSIENIKNEISKLEEQKENLKELELKKLEEYTKEYEKNQEKAKTIDEYISDFEKETDKLYSDNSENLEFHFVNNVINAIKNYRDFSNAIKDGKKVSELLETDNLFSLFKNDFIGLEDYTIAPMPQNLKRKSLLGSHYGGKNKVIFLNMEAIGNDVNKFSRVLLHETEHAKQEKEYNLLKNKVNKTHEDIKKISNFIETKKANKKHQNYYNKHKTVLNSIFNELNKLHTKQQRQDYINNLRPLQKKIYNDYYNLYNEYRNSANEVLARKAENNADKGIEQYEQFEQEHKTENKHTMGGLGQRNTGTRTGNSTEQSEENSKEFDPTGDFEANEELNYDEVDEILPKVNEILPKIKISQDKKLKIRKPNTDFIEKIFTPISTRLENINPRLKHALRKFELDSALAENKYSKSVAPFVEKVSKMSEIDKAKYDLALKNGKSDVINRLNSKYNLTEDYKAVKKVLEDIRNAAIRHGMDVGYLEDYFPRKVIDPSALLEKYSKSSYIRNLLKEIDPDNTLSAEEKIEKINIALKGHNGAINANSSFSKNRKISEITKELNV